jgi:hypothetical protein
MDRRDAFLKTARPDDCVVNPAGSRLHCLIMSRGHNCGTRAQSWLNLQATYDLRVAEQKTGAAIKTLPTPDASHKEHGSNQSGPA